MAVGAHAQTLVVDASNSPYVIQAPATLTQVQVESDGVLVLNAKLSVTADMVVRGGGRVTVDDSVMYLKLAVAGTLTLDFGAAIDADAKGLRGGGTSGFGGNGATLDPVTFEIISGASGQYGSSGSHATPGALGGQMASSPPTYGGALRLSPGGGGGGASGGAGGGVCDITAASVILNGQIRAQGNSGALYNGGGAGGSIGIATTSFSGGGGLIANGNGGGGAGRIRVTSTTWGFTGVVLATGGYGGSWGSVYLLDSMNRFRVMTPVVFSGGETFAEVLLQSGGVLTLSNDSTIQQPLQVPVGTQVVFAGSNSANHVTLGGVDGVVTVNAALALKTKLVVRGTLVVNASLSVPDLDVEMNGLVTHAPQVTGFNLAATNDLNVKFGGAIDASGLGLPGGASGGPFGRSGATVEPVSNAVVAGSGDGNGGSHAGRGGAALATNPVAAVYDDVEGPRSPGGGGGAYAYSSGGNGGGVIRLSAARMNVAGRISSNGTSGTVVASVFDPTGAGAGGTIVISTGPLTGAGQLSARGGAGSGSGSGGGGGIIHIDASSIDATIVRSVAGGSGAAPGTVGASVEHLAATLRIVSAPPTSIKVGQTLSYQATAIGPTPVTWSLLTSPSGAAVSGAGLVTWASFGSVPALFRLQAAADGGTDDQTFSVDVLTPPKITSLANGRATRGEPYEYDADSTAQASGSGPLEWSLVSAPPGFAIEALTGAVTWAAPATGAFAVCLQVKNTVGEAVQCFAIVVEPPTSGIDAGAPLLDAGVSVVDAGAPAVDAGGFSADAGVEPAQPPHFVSSPSTSGYCGVPYRYSGARVPQVDGSGPLSFSVSAIAGGVLPTGLTIDGTTGELSWTPRKEQRGATPIQLTVMNALGRDDQVFSVQVECPEAPNTAVGCSCGASPIEGLWVGLALLITRRRRSEHRSGH